MKFNNSNNNSRDAVNVNTRGMQFMNSEGFSPSTLLFGYWNDMISIKIHPALEKSQQTDSKRFNYEEVVSTAITLEKASTLLTKIENDILPNYGKTDMFRGIPVGGDSLIGVGLKADEGTSYLAIFKALDENTKKPEVAMYYEFKSGYTVNDYNPGTGEFVVDQNVPGELMLFTAGLRSAIAGLTNANAHATRTVDKWFRDRLMNSIEEIGSKVGVETKSKGSWGGGNSYNSRSKDIFGGSGSSQSNSSSSDLDTGSDASVSKLTNIDDINQFMQ